eukprot:12548305-Alexandrium_andersonii.AAC.1
MSASLVGSEMCIRDRAQFPPAPRCGPPLMAAPFGARPSTSESAGRGPVSYTHLTLPTICSV